MIGIGVPLGFAAFWLLSAPKTIDPAHLAGLTGDVARGKAVFDLGGCASCHAAVGAEGDDRLKLGGGRRLVSPFGTFVVPNISPDHTTGIGNWTVVDLVNAMHFGTAPDGSHLYPAFPYTSYQRTTVANIVDLKAYIDTLPAVSRPNEAHDLPFPFTIRRGLGLWKRLFLTSAPVIADQGLSAEALAGRTLVEGMGHCGECHTPRGFLGNSQTQNWLQGAPNPTGKGRIPDLTDHPGGLTWTKADIAEYLKSGFTPDFDTAGGEMADVLVNTAKLTDADRAAIAAYLKSVPLKP